MSSEISRIDWCTGRFLSCLYMHQAEEQAERADDEAEEQQVVPADAEEALAAEVGHHQVGFAGVRRGGDGESQQEGEGAEAQGAAADGSMHVGPPGSDSPVARPPSRTRGRRRAAPESAKWRGGTLLEASGNYVGNRAPSTPAGRRAFVGRGAGKKRGDGITGPVLARSGGARHGAPPAGGYPIRARRGRLRAAGSPPPGAPHVVAYASERGEDDPVKGQGESGARATSSWPRSPSSGTPCRPGPGRTSPS